MSIRFPKHSEYITDDLLEEFKEEKKRKRSLDSQEVTDIVYETDPVDKALTGRTSEIIEEQTGISKEVLFPLNKKILYVGDPWQRMGKELDKSHGSDLTLIDYEFGDAVSFVSDDEYFRNKLDREYLCLVSHAE